MGGTIKQFTRLKARGITPEEHKAVEKLIKLMKMLVTGAFHAHIQPTALAAIAATL